MTVEALYKSMRGLSMAQAKRHVQACNDAMLVANITTKDRAEYWIAQIGHESVDLKYFKEIQGWKGRYAPYYGRGPIQLTWRSNYANFGLWCKGKGLVSDAGIFVRHPDLVAEPKWGWLAAAYYWSVHNLNWYCDRQNFGGLTKAINGGYNGYYDRRRRLAYVRSRRLGKDLLPSKPDRLRVLTDNERAAVKRLTRLREASYRAGEWSSDRKREADKIKDEIRTVYMKAIRVAVKQDIEDGSTSVQAWNRNDRIERYDILGDSYGSPFRD